MNEPFYLVFDENWYQEEPVKEKYKILEDLGESIEVIDGEETHCHKYRVEKLD